MGKSLHLPMIAKWYAMIESLQKPHEYRSITPYWISRLVKKPYANMIKVNCKDAWHRQKYSDNELAEYIESLIKQFGNIFKDFDSIVFSYGYTKRRMEWECDALSIGYGNPAWGAKQGEPCFIIMLGRRVK